MSTGLNDNEIIRLVLSGRSEAYADLVDRYKDYVYTLVFRIIKNREDAEEVAQDVFIRAYRYLSDFKGNAKFSTWLYTIAHNTSLSFLRKKKPAILSLEEDRVQDLADRPEPAGLGLEQKSRAKLVSEAMNMLSADDAQVITLFYHQEQSLDEIASILGIEQNTAKVRLHRARARLKEKMEKQFAGEVRDIF